MSLETSVADSLTTTGSSTSRLADKVYEAVKTMVFNFELLPGTRFSEADLTQRLNVSRTPLRQALQKLESQGFLQVLPKMGWFVAPIDFDVMDELYDLRILMECHAVQLLCDMSMRPQLTALTDVWLVPNEQRLANGAVVGKLDEAFHTTLVAATNNREILKVHQDITERIRLIRRLDFTVADRVNTTYHEHAAILQAIMKNRVLEAQRLVRAHIEHSKIEVRKITLDALHEARLKRLSINF
jgi:DNA-binding GntR family transcriptional regulator